MDDLRARLAALDRVTVPDLWPEIKRRSWTPAPTSRPPQTQWIGTGRQPHWRTSPMLTPVRVLAVITVTALSGGLLALSLSSPSSAPGGIAGTPGSSPGPLASPPVAPAIEWDTGCVQLTADWLRIYPDSAIDDPSRIFTAAATVELNSDPGWDSYRTLEATWHEHDSEMRLFLYLAADEDSWWVRELRTYDGQPTPDWITFPGPLFEAPLGETYQGDVLLNSALIDSAEGNVPGTLELRNLGLKVPDFGPGTGPATCLGLEASNVTDTAQDTPGIVELSPSPSDG